MPRADGWCVADWLDLAESGAGAGAGADTTDEIQRKVDAKAREDSEGRASWFCESTARLKAVITPWAGDIREMPYTCSEHENVMM